MFLFVIVINYMMGFERRITNPVLVVNVILVYSLDPDTSDLRIQKFPYLSMKVCFIDKISISPPSLSLSTVTKSIYPTNT